MKKYEVVANRETIATFETVDEAKMFAKNCGMTCTVLNAQCDYLIIACYRAL